MSSFCKSHFFSKNISVYAIFNDQSFNNMLTNDMLVLNNWALKNSDSIQRYIHNICFYGKTKISVYSFYLEL